MASETREHGDWSVSLGIFPFGASPYVRFCGHVYDTEQERTTDDVACEWSDGVLKIERATVADVDRFCRLLPALCEWAKEILEREKGGAE